MGGAAGPRPPCSLGAHSHVTMCNLLRAHSREIRFAKNVRIERVA